MSADTVRLCAVKFEYGWASFAVQETALRWSNVPVGGTLTDGGKA
jgi:hypothetical protein